MKKTFKSIFTVALILFFGSFISAQNLKDQRKRLTELKTVLGLTPEQAIQIKKIFKETKPERIELKGKREEAIKNKVKDQRKIVKQNLMSFREETRGKIKAVLTPDQQLKFEQMIQEREEILLKQKEEKMNLKKAKIQDPITN